MRKMDVNGYASRTAAVYDCLALDFVGPQTVDLPPGAGEAVVSLIEMSDTVNLDPNLVLAGCTHLNARVCKVLPNTHVMNYATNLARECEQLTHMPCAGLRHF